MIEKMHSLLTFDMTEEEKYIFEKRLKKMKETLKEKLERLRTERILLGLQRKEVNKEYEIRITELDLQIEHIEKEIAQIEEATSA